MENEEIRTVKVSDKGQISIPNSLRQRLKINRGDNLILMEFRGKILIEKSKSFSDKLKDDFRDILKISEESLREVWDNESDEIWNDYLK